MFKKKDTWSYVLSDEAYVHSCVREQVQTFVQKKKNSLCLSHFGIRHYTLLVNMKLSLNEDKTKQYNWINIYLLAY